MNSSSFRPLAGWRSKPARIAVALVVALALILWAAVPASAQNSGHSAGTTYALNTSGELIAFDRGAPGEIDSRVAIDGEEMIGVDFRPATGELWGIGVSGAVYTIDPASGAVTTQGQISEPLQGNVFEVDFNPSADAIRVLSDTGQNLRLAELDNEIETNVDGNLAYAQGDANAGVSPAVVAGAYSNNLDGVEETALYDFDLATGNYVQQDPPNDGVLNTIGPPGVGFTSLVGFDITSLGGADEGFAAIQTAEGQPSVLYGVDAESGAVSEIGVIGDGEYVSDLAIPTTEMEALPDTGGPSLTALITVAGAGILISAGLALGLSARRRNA